MKFFFPLVVFLLLSACRPVHTTQQYYNDYVNPTASVDYDDTVSADIPVEFLDDYYTIDSKIVRFVDQIVLLDSRLDNSWIELQKSIHSWIKYIATMYNDHLFIAGDDTLGFDPEVREFLTGLSTKEKRFFLFKNDRTFLIDVASVANKKFMTTIVELDPKMLTAEVPNNRTVLSVDDHVFGVVSTSLTDRVGKLQSAKRYSGQFSLDDKEWYWIRSMASDNLLYLYSN